MKILNFTAITLSLFVLYAPHAMAKQPTYFYLQAQHSNKCAHQQGNLQDEGVAVTQWECIDEDNVKLEKVDVGDGYFMLRFPHSDKCITIQGNPLANGSNIAQESCSTTAPRYEQMWQEVKVTEDAADPFVYIKSSYGLCLHQEGATQGNGDKISTWECVNQPNVLWKFTKADCSAFLQPYIDWVKDGSPKMLTYTLTANTPDNHAAYWANNALTFKDPSILRVGDESLNGQLNIFSLYGGKFLNSDTLSIRLGGTAGLNVGQKDVHVRFGSIKSDIPVQCSKGHMVGVFNGNVMFDITLNKVYRGDVPR